MSCACFASGLLLLSTACASAPKLAAGLAPNMLYDPITAPAALQVTSESFAPNGPLAPAYTFNGMGCTGQNISPQLSWKGAPVGTQSYAVLVHDPDAPTGVGFFHWSLFDLPKTATDLSEGIQGGLPAGSILGITDAGAPGYAGPCPPPGQLHHYVFTVYALDVPHLGGDAHATGALLRFMLKRHTVAYGRLIGTYQR